MLCGGGMEAEVELVRQQGEGWLIIMQHTVHFQATHAW